MLQIAKMNCFKSLLLLFCLSACNSSRQQQQRQTPTCISEMIRQFQQEARQNPPRSVSEFDFRGNTVYYVPAVCCDQMSAVYDSLCKYMGAPDGGLTGKGDGKIPGFRDSAKNERMIWKDIR
ncbi:MAG: hypothetical protein ABIQ56_02170 [Chitinophagaceae bacterium]